MLAQAMVRSHASQVEHHATMWVAKNSQEHLNQIGEGGREGWLFL